MNLPVKGLLTNLPVKGIISLVLSLTSRLLSLAMTARLELEICGIDYQTASRSLIQVFSLTLTCAFGIA